MGVGRRLRSLAGGEGTPAVSAGWHAVGGEHPRAPPPPPPRTSAMAATLWVEILPAPHRSRSSSSGSVASDRYATSVNCEVANRFSTCGCGGCGTVEVASSGGARVSPTPFLHPRRP